MRDEAIALDLLLAGPHGLVADRDGNIWCTAVFKGYVGKLNPTTGEITEYHMPDPRARDPHTPTFDQQGVLWFTMEESNFVGRLDPRRRNQTEAGAHGTCRALRDRCLAVGNSLLLRVWDKPLGEH